jgi:hypothetical protein
MCDLVTYISLDLVTVIPLFCVQEVLSLVDDLPKKIFFFYILDRYVGRKLPP